MLEIAATELKSITEEYNHSKARLEKYKIENQKAIDLFNEQMSILCNLKLKLNFINKK
jgi:hypothetical protein